MHTNKTKEEDAVISVRLCGFQLENKVMSILEKKPLEGLSWFEEVSKKNPIRNKLVTSKTIISSKNLSLMLGNLMISKDKIVKVKSIRF